MALYLCMTTLAFCAIILISPILLCVGVSIILSFGVVEPIRTVLIAVTCCYVCSTGGSSVVSLRTQVALSVSSLFGDIV